MREGIGQRTIHKLSDFLSNESGRVGAKSALAMGGLVGAAALTQMMFAPETQAHELEGCRGWQNCATFGDTSCCCNWEPLNHNGLRHQKCKPIAFCRNWGGSCIN